MPIGLSLWFEDGLERRLRALWGHLRERGIDSSLYDGGYRPHLTLGVWETTRLDELRRALAAHLLDRPAFEVEFRSVGLFPEGAGVAFLQPVVTSRLVTLQREVHELASGFGRPHLPYFLPERWVPHCTMAWEVPRARILEAAGLLLSEALPLTGSVAALGMLDTPAEVELDRYGFRRLG